MDSGQKLQIDTIGLAILTVSDEDSMISLWISEGPIKLRHTSLTTVLVNEQLPVILELHNGIAELIYGTIPEG